MDFAKTYTLESTSLPGVVVTLARMGPKKRAEVELSVSTARSKQRELSMRHESIRQKLLVAIDACPKDDEGKPIEADIDPTCIHLMMELQSAADDAAALVKAQIHPAFIKAAVKSFGGTELLTYDGKPASADLLIECGPDSLFDELVAKIQSNGYISAESAGNLSAPSTSEGPGDGKAMSTTAPSASPGTSTKSGAA